MHQAVLPEVTLQEEGAASAVLPEAGRGSPIITRTPSMVMMAVGALIREGLVLAHPSNLEVMVESAG